MIKCCVAEEVIRFMHGCHHICVLRFPELPVMCIKID